MRRMFPAFAVAILAMMAATARGQYHHHGRGYYNPMAGYQKQMQQQQKQAAAQEAAYEKEMARRRAIVMQRWRAEQMIYRKRAQFNARREEEAIEKIQERQASHKDRGPAPSPGLASGHPTKDGTK